MLPGTLGDIDGKLEKKNHNKPEFEVISHSEEKTK